MIKASTQSSQRVLLVYKADSPPAETVELLLPSATENDSETDPTPAQ